jgi:hypothetical protein
LEHILGNAMFSHLGDTTGVEKKVHLITLVETGSHTAQGRGSYCHLTKWLAVKR